MEDILEWLLRTIQDAETGERQLNLHPRHKVTYEYGTFAVSVPWRNLHPAAEEIARLREQVEWLLEELRIDQGQDWDDVTTEVRSLIRLAGKVELAVEIAAAARARVAELERELEGLSGAIERVRDAAMNLPVLTDLDELLAGQIVTTCNEIEAEAKLSEEERGDEITAD